MTKLLEKAFEEARKLPPDEQDTIGAIILEEIKDEALWAQTFADSQDVLEKLAEEALAEIESGEATPLEFPPRK